MMLSDIATVLSNTRLKRFSIDQANSLMSDAFTMRPLPFKVWKARLTVVNDSISSWFDL